MQPGLKGRAGRLQVFARHLSEGQTNHDAEILNNKEPEVKTDDLRATASAPPERQLQADVPRPVPPKTDRAVGLPQRGINGPTQPLIPSFRRDSPQPPRHKHLQFKTEEPINEIFHGSQLGENFMHSGLTTPHSELIEPAPAPSPGRRHRDLVQRGPGAVTKLNEGFRTGENAAFQVREDMQIKVVSGARRFNPSHMKDGFLKDALNGHSRPASPVQKQPQPPARHVKIRTVPVPRHTERHRERHNEHPHERHIEQPKEQYEYATQEIRGASPSPAPGHWSAHPRLRRHGHVARYQESEEDSESLADREDIQSTPKATRSIITPPNLPLESALPAAVAQYKFSRANKRRRGSIDYDDKALSTMTYTALQKEPFDFDPAKVTVHDGYGTGAGKLSAKLEQCRHQGEKEQRSMFEGMSVDDWETAGDWFADQFASIMERLRDSRRHKRRMIRAFESEAASREEAVRLLSGAIDRKLAKMKQDGQRVVAENDILGRFTESK